MEIILFFGLLILIGWVFTHGSRLDSLEIALRDGKPATTPERVPDQYHETNSSLATAKTEDTPEPVEQVEIIASSQTTPPATHEPSFDLMKWLTTEWQLKLGAFLVLLSLGWFVRYAIIFGWINEVTRIAIGIVVGAMIAIYGYFRGEKTSRTQGDALLVLGSSIILTTIFFARNYYDMLTPVFALVLMFAVSCAVSLVSVQRQSARLSIAAVIMASISPFLTASPTQNTVAIMSYALCIQLGAFWLSYVLKKDSILLASSLSFTFYTLLFASEAAQQPILMVFGFVFAALTLSAQIATQRLSIREESVVSPVIALLTAFSLYFWIQSANTFENALIAIWAVIQFLLAGMSYKQKHSSTANALLGAAAVYLITATANQFEGNVLIVAFTLEAYAATWITFAITKQLRIASRVLLTLAIPTLLSFELFFSSAWTSDQRLETIATLLLLTVAAFTSGFIYLQKTKPEEELETKILLFHLGAIYSYLMIWKISEVSAPEAFAVPVALVIYTLIGLVLNIYGQQHKKLVMRLHGAAVLLFVTARLLLVDIHTMSLAGRTVTFFLIGALLITTSLLGRSKIFGIHDHTSMDSES